MFTVNDARCSNQLETVNKQRINMNKWLFHHNGFTRTSLSAIVTRISNFVEGNVFHLLHRQGFPSGAFRRSLPNTSKYVICNALGMFKALNTTLKADLNC